MTGRASTARTDRVVERRRAVALARHYREFEGLSIRQIADRLGRSPATIKAYFYDPSGDKARAVKARYQGVCRGCGASTQARNGKGDAYEYCKAVPAGRDRGRTDTGAGARRDARLAEPVRPPPVLLRLVAYPCPPARRQALARLDDGDWPPASIVGDVYGSWAKALADAFDGA